jgi:hypothetical protein
VGVRSRHLYDTLHGFCLGSFRVLSQELEEGAELPFAFEEHRAPGRPPLYEYRPLVSRFVEARAPALAGRDDARIALEALRREPATAIFAAVHEGGEADASLFRSILVPLVVKTAQACGGFDWDDAGFAEAYAELEHALYGEQRSYTALAPLVGVTLGAAVDLGACLRVRHAVAGELSAHWAEAGRLVPPRFGREPARLSLLELQHPLEDAAALPDAPAEVADAVTAIRLATAGPVAAGPVLFERLDWQPLGVRPVLPIASTQPEGEPTGLDQFRGGLAAQLVGRLGRADDDPDLGDALDRWELSLFQDDPLRSEQLRASLTALLGAGDGVWAAALRAATLLGESGRDRAQLLASLRVLAQGHPAEGNVRDAVRRALVESLLHGDRRSLVDELDESLVGVRARPAGYLARAAG